MNMAIVILNPLIRAEEKTFYLLINYEFYLLLSPLLRKKKRYFVY